MPAYIACMRLLVPEETPAQRCPPGIGGLCKGRAGSVRAATDSAGLAYPPPRRAIAWCRTNVSLQRQLDSPSAQARRDAVSTTLGYHRADKRSRRAQGGSPSEHSGDRGVSSPTLG